VIYASRRGLDLLRQALADQDDHPGDSLGGVRVVATDAVR
jgi:hypothetical protein